MEITFAIFILFVKIPRVKPLSIIVTINSPVHIWSYPPPGNRTCERLRSPPTPPCRRRCRGSVGRVLSRGSGGSCPARRRLRGRCVRVRPSYSRSGCSVRVCHRDRRYIQLQEATVEYLTVNVANGKTI